MNVTAFRCAVCFNPFVQPVTVSCGHTFCRACLEHAVDAAGRSRGEAAGGHGDAASARVADSVVPDVVHPETREDEPAVGIGCPSCRAPLPPRASWATNVAIAAAIEEIGRIATNELDPASITLGPVLSSSNTTTVYRGEYQGRAVAVKQYAEEIGPKERQRRNTEVHIMRSLHHRNIVDFIGMCTSPQFCIVSELVPLGSVRDVLKGPGLGAFAAAGTAPTMAARVRTIVAMLLDVARGMSYLHSQHVLHRNLKTDNILVDDTGRAKICDFRTSAISQDMICKSGGNSTGIDVNALPWLAPERLRGERYSVAADVYSFAMCMYEMVMGSTPFEEMSDAFQIILHVTSGNRPPIDERCPTILADIMRSCWDPLPERRPEFADVVRAFESDDVRQMIEAIEASAASS